MKKIHKCRFCDNEFIDWKRLAGHVPRCKMNPKREKNIQAVADSLKGKPISKESKSKISESMKKAHREGRAFSIGTIKKSYSEQFWEKVFKEKREFSQYNIQQQFRVDRYYIDFAFVDIKIAFETDGLQHLTNQKQIEHDRVRDEFLISQGWKVYRVSWKKCKANQTETIQKFLKYLNNYQIEQNLVKDY